MDSFRLHPQKSAVEEQETVEGTPPWATELFNKMKKEICAEVHARVAYSMRIMLDHLKDEILTQLDNPNVDKEGGGCYCKELKKCKACKDKKHALKAALHVQRKEEKKILKQNKRQVSSESDSDNEFQPFPRPRNITHAAPEPKLSGSEQNGLSVNPSLIVNKAKPILNEIKDVESVAKIVNCPPIVKDETEIVKTSITSTTGDFDVKKETKKDVTAADTEFEGEMGSVPFSQSSPSDSEFEVVSLPPINPSTHYQTGDRDATASDFDDTSVSGHCSETETETEFKDCKQSAGDLASAAPLRESLYPQLHNENMTMASSTSSAVSGDSYATLGEDTVAGAEACAAEVETFVPERQRAPYSVTPPAGTEKENVGGIINNQPMPPEFQRERQPYNQACAGPKAQETLEQPQAQAKAQPPEQTRAPPKPTPRSSATYRTDNLPESLWDEALTVAAQTYNAAKTAVENLADTFVPGVERVVLSPARTGSIPMHPPPVGATTQGPRPAAPLLRLTEAEQKIYDMGFTDTVRNSRLLHKYNNDIQRALQDLLGA